MAPVAIPVRLVPLFSLRSAVLLGIILAFVLAISVAAAVPILFGPVSPATIVVLTLLFARGKAARHALGEQGRCREMGHAIEDSLEPGVPAPGDARPPGF